MRRTRIKNRTRSKETRNRPGSTHSYFIQHHLLLVLVLVVVAINGGARLVLYDHTTPPLIQQVLRTKI